MRYAFAGDRAISTNLLKFLISKGNKPLALFVTKGSNETHSSSLIEISGLNKLYIFEGTSFSSPENIVKLKSLNLDYIFGIHFPYIIPEVLLDIPKVGFLNLHPAYLPFNKGWHTPSWAILENTKYGATLHFMIKELDQGDIIHQKEIVVTPRDTANSLYQKTLALEEEVFKEAYDDLLSLSPRRVVQTRKGTSHNKKDLEQERIIQLDEKNTGKNFINKLRGLTTNNLGEAAYFEEKGRKYAIQVIIQEIN